MLQKPLGIRYYQISMSQKISSKSLHFQEKLVPFNREAIKCFIKNCFLIPYFGFLANGYKRHGGSALSMHNLSIEQM